MIPYKKQMNGRMPGDWYRRQGCTFRETASAHALQHRFCHHPQCAIELNVGINAVNGPGNQPEMRSQVIFSKHIAVSCCDGNRLFA